MPRDFGVELAEPSSPKGAAGGRRRIAGPGRTLAAALGIAAAGLLIGYLAAVLVFFPSEDAAVGLTRVPTVVGLAAEAAREHIQAAGLEYEEGPGLHDRAATGTVVAQDPLAGQMAAPGSAVQVTISLGPKLFPVPDVVGLAYTQAETVLARAGFQSELVWADADALVGRVVDTRPGPGTPIELPGKVRLVASAGPATVRVPNLVTQSLAEARATLKQLGLRLGEVRQDSASMAAPGTVLTQSPSAGTVVKRATRVAVSVAIEPKPAQQADTVPAQQ